MRWRVILHLPHTADSGSFCAALSLRAEVTVCRSTLQRRDTKVLLCCSRTAYLWAGLGRNSARCTQATRIYGHLMPSRKRGLDTASVAVAIIDAFLGRIIDAFPGRLSTLMLFPEVFLIRGSQFRRS